MERRIVFATGNENKMTEIRMILSDLGMPVYSMKELGVEADIVEDGISFEENAEIKARAISRLLPDDIVLADDSGLEIDYLDKAPGIYSARFAGEDTSYDVKNCILLDKLEGIPDEERTARFVCAVAAAFPDGSVETVRGTIEGTIAKEMLGENGIVIVSATLDKATKKVLAGPEIVTRGFIYVKEHQNVIDQAKESSLEIIERNTNFEQHRVDYTKIKNEVREVLGKYFYKETECKPMIITVVQEV